MDEPFSQSKPIYLQIVERICRSIVRSDLPPGGKLPSVREAAVQYGVNPNTVQRVYTELEMRAVAETRRGQGTFVTPSPQRIAALREELKRKAIAELVKEMEEMGFSPQSIREGVEEYLQNELSTPKEEHGNECD